MTSPLPSLRLTGATVLRDGMLQDRTVAISGGRIDAGPYPAVDLSGFYVLPGIVDLGFARALDGTPEDLTAAAARAGVTTGWVTLPWQDDHAPLVALTRPRPNGPDLRCGLRYDIRATGGDRLLSAVRRFGVDRVVFCDTPADPGTRLRSPEIPRRLCRLAEAFDILGVVYGSHGDPDGETREFHSMLGARICEAPLSSQAAAMARAVGDPVVAQVGAADDSRARALVRAGKCDALMSGGGPQPLAQAAFGLVRDRILPLERAWPLISAVPAEIQRLPMRGTIARGKRADLAIVRKTSGAVEATIAGGRLVHAAGLAQERFAAAEGAPHLAAE